MENGRRTNKTMCPPIGVLAQDYKAFEVGDEIRVQTFEGRVGKISMRTIAIENIDGNASFLSDSIFRISSVIIKKEHSIQGTREEPI
jgi:small-conductance mechanosensitive channel